MQRLECRRFADMMGWKIVYELQEEGISGHKVRAEQRDQIQKVKELAKQKSVWESKASCAAAGSRPDRW